MRGYLSPIIGLVALTLFLAPSSYGQECGGIPWTITATPAGAETLSIHVCGLFGGCRPHNPRYTISGSEIRITLTQAEGNCFCLGITDTFSVSVAVGPLSPGTYTVIVIAEDCLRATVMGTSSVVLSAAASVPMLDLRGIALLALLLAMAAAWLLRA